jgi:hypothetical protein
MAVDREGICEACGVMNHKDPSPGDRCYECGSYLAPPPPVKVKHCTRHGETSFWITCECGKELDVWPDQTNECGCGREWKVIIVATEVC